MRMQTRIKSSESEISLSHKKADTHISVNVEFGDEEGLFGIDLV